MAANYEAIDRDILLSDEGTQSRTLFKKLNRKVKKIIYVRCSICARRLRWNPRTYVFLEGHLRGMFQGEKEDLNCRGPDAAYLEFYRVQLRKCCTANIFQRRPLLQEYALADIADDLEQQTTLGRDCEIYRNIRRVDAVVPPVNPAPGPLIAAPPANIARDQVIDPPPETIGSNRWIIFETLLFLFLLLVFFVAVASWTEFNGIEKGDSSSKIQVSLADELRLNGSADAVVIIKHEYLNVLKTVASLDFSSRGQRIEVIKPILEQLASKAQKNVVSILNKRNVKFTKFWITSKIFVDKASLEVLTTISDLPEVQEVRQQKIALIDKPIHSLSVINEEWGIKKIEAKAAWSLPGGNYGQGIIVATIDTGVRATHEALRETFRKSKGWFDPYYMTDTPTDEDGHGTHTMGSIAGWGGIGVAPGVQWISCRGCLHGSCTEKALVSCGQFLLCPTDVDGSNPNCNQTPQIISNSWGIGQGETWYDEIIEIWRQADIIPLFSQGNHGPACASANSPGDSPKVISVGATTKEDGIATFSSLGPALGGGLKPDICAPGEMIRSSWHIDDTAYKTLSGTSMACPHAAGVAALLLSQNPTISFEKVKTLLQKTAERRLQHAPSCDGIPSNAFPNYVYGYGRINARMALTAAIAGL